MKSGSARRVLSWLLAGLLMGAALLRPGVARAEQVTVRYPEGTVHGFLLLRTLNGKTLAAGDLIEVIKGDRVISNLVFHFKDGSIDDETTIFSQHHRFRLLSDHHIQKGPSFPHPMDISIHASSGQVTVRSSGGKGRKGKVETYHLDLPADLANGLVLTLVKNIGPDVKDTKLSYVADASKPQLVKIEIIPEGKETFSVGGFRYKAMRYVVKVDLGGITGFLAKLLGKQPKPTHVWVVSGKAPAFVKSEGQFYQGGPIWRTELASPVWQKSRRSGH
ncbi:MAG TPA: hypothetical protein VFZ08_03365 [Terriglobia bacterium]|nr:hypothetical protein [Terriglobia bacterium]